VFVNFLGVWAVGLCMYTEETTFGSVDHLSIPDSCPECGESVAEKEVLGETEFVVTCVSCGEMVFN